MDQSVSRNQSPQFNMNQQLFKELRKHLFEFPKYRNPDARRIMKSLEDLFLSSNIDTEYVIKYDNQIIRAGTLVDGEFSHYLARAHQVISQILIAWEFQTFKDCPVSSGEYNFRKRLLSHLPELKVERHVYLGRHAIDLFLPDYALAIEINGCVHDRSAVKASKDHFTDFRMMEFGILPFPVPKDRVFKLSNSLASEITLGRIKSIAMYERDAKLNQIYIYTIATLLPTHLISRIFGVDLTDRSFESWLMGDKVA